MMIKIGNDFMVEREKLALIYAAGVKLRERALHAEVLKPNHGICYNLSKELEALGCADKDICYCLVEVCSASWPHSKYPGEYSPLPVKEDLSCGTWKGMNYLQRVDLLEHILRKVAWAHNNLTDIT